MKHALATLCLLIGASAGAQDNATTTAPAAAGNPLQWSVFAMYSTAKSFEYKGTISDGSSKDSFDQTDNASGAPGIGFTAGTRFNELFSAEVGLSYEFEREFDDASGNSGGIPFAGDYASPKPTFSVAVLFINGTVDATEKLYFLAGINYPFIKYDASDNVLLEESIGFQAGAGIKLPYNLQAEIQYRVLKTKISYLTNVSGTDLLVDAKGDFNGINFVLKWYL